MDSRIKDNKKPMPVESYPIVEAAIHWCGLTGRMEEIRASIEYGLLKTVKMDKVEYVVGSAALKDNPDLSEKLGWLRIATDNLELPWISCYDLKEAGISVSLYWSKPNDRIIKRTDLKNWMTKYHPDEKPPFLFSIEERKKLESNESTIGTNERYTLLIIIEALSKLPKLDLKDRGSASRISEMTQEIGSPITAETIRSKLVQIRDAIEARRK